MSVGSRIWPDEGSARACEIRVGSDRCGRPGVAFAAGATRCAAHLPKADPTCSHSLTTDGRCSYCGGEVKRCRAEDCDRPASGGRECGMHKSRRQRHGSYDDPRPTFAERFWSKVDQRGPDECWPWLAFVAADGYGRFSPTTDTTRVAHRVGYELAVGPVADALELDHLCRNRRCCNPTHLEPVTGAENKRRSPLTLNGINAAKTHCIHGHPLDGDNVQVDKHGHRRCVTCRSERESRRQRTWRAVAS